MSETTYGLMQGRYPAIVRSVRRAWLLMSCAAGGTTLWRSLGTITPQAFLLTW